MGLLHKMMDLVSRTLHQQGRFLRRQVFDLALTLMIIGGGMLLFLAAMIVGGMTAYAAMAPVIGPAGALAIITLWLLMAAIAMTVVGYHIQSQSDDKASLYNNAYEKDGQYRGDERDDARARREKASSRRMHDFAPGQPPRNGPSAQAYDADASQHQPAGGAGGIDEIEMARAYLSMTREQLNRKLDIVRRHPVTAVGLAMGLGLLLGRSKSARDVARGAMTAGGKKLAEHYFRVS